MPWHRYCESPPDSSAWQFVFWCSGGRVGGSGLAGLLRATESCKSPHLHLSCAASPASCGAAASGDKLGEPAPGNGAAMPTHSGISFFFEFYIYLNEHIQTIYLIDIFLDTFLEIFQFEEKVFRVAKTFLAKFFPLPRSWYVAHQERTNNREKFWLKLFN